MRIDGLTSRDVVAVTARILALPDFGRGAFTTIDVEGERMRPLP